MITDITLPSRCQVVSTAYILMCTLSFMKCHNQSTHDIQYIECASVGLAHTHPTILRINDSWSLSGYTRLEDFVVV